MRVTVVGGLVFGVGLACAHRSEPPAGDVFVPMHAACDAGDVATCVRLAKELHELRNYRKGAEEEGYRVDAQACGFGHAASCELQAYYLEFGCCGAPGVDKAGVLTLRERACDLGNLQACRGLALAYTIQGAPDRKLRADERGCALGAEDLCMATLDSYLDTFSPDWAAVDRVLGRLACPDPAVACDGKRGVYLLTIGQHERPEDQATQARRAHARELIARGCEVGEPDACINLADLLARGVGGPVEAPRALALFDAGCERGAARSCWGAARMRVMVPALRDLAAARAGFDRACAGREGVDLRECRLAAAENFAAGGATREAADLFAPLCEAGDPMSCVRWGRTLAETPKSYRQAVTLFRGACDAGEPRGCARLARMMALGRGIKRDRAAADALAARACAAGATEACTLSENLASLAGLASGLAGPARKLLRITAAVTMFPVWQIMVGDWW